MDWRKEAREWAEIVGSLALAIVWGGYVITVLWAWFVVPTFGVQPLSIATAAGLRLLSTFFNAMPSADKTTTTAAQRWWLRILSPLMLLGIGWIVHRFV